PPPQQELAALPARWSPEAPPPVTASLTLRHFSFSFLPLHPFSLTSGFFDKNSSLSAPHACVPQSLTGNCFLLKLNGNMSSSEGHNGIRGRKTRIPECCPTTISASIVFF
ncbi:hypothetical protein ZWY2020_014395, partial [Hordeum vulgare]